jgi:hypothetical protein
MNPVIIAVLAAMTGYLLGSLSFARIVTALVEPGRRVEKLQVSVPDSDVEFEAESGAPDPGFPSRLPG